MYAYICQISLKKQITKLVHHLLLNFSLFALSIYVSSYHKFFLMSVQCI